MHVPHGTTHHKRLMRARLSFLVKNNTGSGIKSAGKVSMVYAEVEIIYCIGKIDATVY